MNASIRNRPFQPRLHRLEDRITSAAGMLDPTFGDGGQVTTRLPAQSHDKGQAIAIDSMGRILVAGSVYNGWHFEFGITRYTPVGAWDCTFGGTGAVTISFGGYYDGGHRRGCRFV